MFNKLFTKILDSSIWLEPVTTRIVWITLLAAMDEDGYAHFSAVENLASRARVTVEEAKAALECFMAADPNSGNPANDGRRVERVPGGFLVLNAAYHREAMNRVIQREQTRQRVAAWRVDNPEPKKKRPVGKVYSPAARAVLCYLREQTGRPFRETASNLELIDARLSEPGVDVDGCKKMIDRQILRWKGTPQEEYLQPTTLFGKQKFDGYYSARDLPVADQNGLVPGKPLSVMDLNTILKAKQTEADALKLKYCSTMAMGDQWNDEQARQKYIGLKKEIKELNSKIGRMA